MARQSPYGSREGSLESEVCFSSSPEVVSDILPFQEPADFGLKLGLDAAGGLLTSVPLMDHYPQHDMSENQEWLNSLRSRSWQEANSCSEYLANLQHYNYNCEPLDMYGGVSSSACSSFNLAVAGTAANSFSAMQVTGFNAPEEYHFTGMSPQQLEQQNSSFHLISEFKANQEDIPQHGLFDQAFPHYLPTNATADTAAGTGYQDPFLAAFSNSAANDTGTTNNIASCMDLSSKGSHKKLDKVHVANDQKTKCKDRMNTSGCSHLQPPEDKPSKRPANKEAKASSSNVSTESGSRSSVIDSCVEKPKKRLQEVEEHPAQQQVISKKRVHLEVMQPVKNSAAASTKLQPVPIAAKVSSSYYYSDTPTKATRTPALNTNLKPRARQGSANDPQSIAARHRRERISDRLKILQDLVPNSAKVDLVTMLEKAINYVKFLQLQVKVLTADEYWPEHKGKNSTHEVPVEESAPKLMVPVQ